MAQPKRVQPWITQRDLPKILQVSHREALAPRLAKCLGERCHERLPVGCAVLASLLELYDVRTDEPIAQAQDLLKRPTGRQPSYAVDLRDLGDEVGKLHRGASARAGTGGARSARDANRPRRTRRWRE